MITGTVKIDLSGSAAVLSEAKKRNITLKGARAAGKVLLPAARAGAPRRTRSGALRAAQGVVAKKGSRGLTLSLAVQGARKRVVRFVLLKGYKTPQKVVPAFYDHLVQFGTKPHRLGKGESLGRVGKRKKVAPTGQTTGGQHPGTKANPFRKRAWESVKGAAGAAAVKAMGEELNKILAKQRAKYGG